MNQFGNGGTGTYSSAGMQAMQGAPTPLESPSRIRDAVTMAETMLAALHEQIAQFEKRLDTVLTPAPPTASVGNAVQSQVRSHLVGRLDQVNEAIRLAGEKIMSLQQRVEL